MEASRHQSSDVFRAPVRLSRSPVVLLGAIVVVGVVLRLGYLSLNPSLWSDESAVLLNLESRTYLSLAQPLALNQHAPYLFLVAEKAVHSVAGVRERWLRLPSALASNAALIIFAFLVHAATSARAGVMALAILAVSPALVRYSAELKPYANDVLACVIALAVGFVLLRRGYTIAHCAAAALIGAVLVWGSYASVFVLAGVGAVLIVDRLMARDVRGALLATATCAVWGLSLLVEFVVILRHSLENDYLASFWDYAFVPFPPTSAWESRRVLELLGSVFVSPLGLGSAALGAFLWVVGIAQLVRRSWQLAGFCIVPVLVVFGASAVHAYPFGGRLMLFLTPLLAFPIGEGLGAVISPLRQLTYPVLALLTLTSPVLALNDLFDAPEISGVRDLLPVLGARAREGDSIYVYYHAELPYRVYASRLNRDDLRVHIGRDVIRERDSLRSDLAVLGDATRVWLLFSEVQTFFGNEELAVLSEADAHGVPVDKVEVPGARAYLYSFPSGIDGVAD